MNGEVPKVVNDDGRLNPKSIANLMASVVQASRQDPNPIGQRKNITPTKVTAEKIASVKNKYGYSKKPKNVYPAARSHSTQFLNSQTPSPSSESYISSIVNPPPSSLSPSNIKSEFISSRETGTIFNNNNNGDESENNVVQPQSFITVINYNQSSNNVDIKQEEMVEEQVEHELEMGYSGFSLEEQEEEEIDVICSRCDNTHFVSLSNFLSHLKFCRLKKQCNIIKLESVSTTFDFETEDVNITPENEHSLINNNNNGSNIEQDPLLQPIKSEIF